MINKGRLGGPRPLPSFGGSLSPEAQYEMKRMGVNTGGFGAAVAKMKPKAPVPMRKSPMIGPMRPGLAIRSSKKYKAV